MFKLSPRQIVAISFVSMLGFVPTSVVAQSTPAGSNPWDKYDTSAPQKATPAATQPAKTQSSSVGSNPWDKYDTSAIKAAGAAASASTSTSAGANPWDKYDTSASKSKSTTAAPADGAANPWEKYATDPVPMVPFAPNTPSNTVEGGVNPWDKYTPAAMPKVTPKHRATKEKPKNLELAPPLPERKVPAGPNKVVHDFKIGKKYYYAIDYNNQLIGYSEFHISNEIALGGRASYVMNSTSRVKVGTDTISDLRYESQMQVSKRDLAPASFICTQKSTKDDYRITCIYSPNVVAQNNIIADQVNSYVHTLESDSANMLFNNLWGQMDTFAEHYWLLALAANKGGTVKVYDPILRSDGQVTVYAPVSEKWTSQKKSYRTLVYAISDLYGSPLAKVRLDAKTKELLEIKEIGSGVTFRVSTPGVVKQVNKAKGVNIWPAKIRLSNIYFSDPQQLTHLEADLEMSLRGGQLAQHAITGYEQKMYGTVKEGKIDGRVVVDVKPTNIKQTTVFPMQDSVPDEILPYLKFNTQAETNDNAIYNKANELTWKTGTTYQAARRLTGFIANDIANGISLPSALQTLEHGVGNPESKALLLVAMARSVGIPARGIGGLVYNKGEFAPHYWAELWLGPEAKWMAFDPSTNEAGSVNASHIALWQSGDVQDLHIEVEKFAPHPQRQVHFFNEKLRWPVGEKRTYAIVSNGKRVGTEIGHLQDLQLVDNRESYSFHAESQLFDKPQDIPEVGAKLTSESAEEEQEETTAADATSADGSTAEGTAAEGTAAEGGTAEGATTEGTTAEGTAAEGTTAEGSSAQVAAADGTTASAPPAEGATPASTQNKGTGSSASATPTASATPAVSAKPAASTKPTASAAPATGSGSQPSNTVVLAADGTPIAPPAAETNAPDTAGQDATTAADSEAPAAPEVPAEPPKVVSTLTSDTLYNAYALPMHTTVKEKVKDKEHEVKLRFSSNRVYEESEVNGQKIEREIPVPNGLYLTDQRFLSQWALALEQVNIEVEQEDQETGVYSLYIFVPELLSFQELLLTEDEEQYDVTMPDGTTITTTCLRSEQGMEFYIDAQRRVVRIAVPNRNLELYLLTQEFSLE